VVLRGQCRNVSGIAPGTSASISASASLNGTQTVGIGSLNQTFSLTYADDSTLSGASSNLGNQAITVTGNVYNHASGSATGATISLPDSIVGYSGTLGGLSNASISNASGFRVNLKTTGTTGAGFDALGGNASGIAPGASASISASASLNGTQTVGIGSLNQTFNLTYADDSTLSGASSNLGSQSISVTGNVYNHSSTGGFSGGTIALPGLIVGYAGPVNGANSLGVTNGLGTDYRVNLKATGGASNNVTVGGFGGIAPGSTGNLTAALAAGQAVGAVSETVNVTLADDSTLNGASANLTTWNVHVSGNVFDHATASDNSGEPGSFAGGTLSLGNIHQGYAAPVASSNSRTVYDGASGDNRVALSGSGAETGGTTAGLSLNSIGGSGAIGPGASAQISAALATGLSAGPINQLFVYTFADDSSLNGASSNVGAATIVVTGNVYSGQSTWTGASGGFWASFSNWDAGGAPGLDPNFTTTDAATLGNTSGSVAVDLHGAAPSLNALTFNSTGSYSVTDTVGTGSLTLAGPAPSITSAGTHMIAVPVVLAADTAVTVSGSSDSLTISGAIRGASGSLSLFGSGTFVLSAANSYGGGTTVNSGTLRVTNTSGSATGSGSVALNGGTLASGAVGMISGAVNAGSGTNNIAPGGLNSIGTLDLGSTLSLNRNSVLHFDLNGANDDLLAVTGALSIASGTPAITFDSVSGLLSGHSYTLATFATSALTNSSFSASDVPAGFKLQIDPTDIELVPANASVLSLSPSHLVVRSMVGGSQTGTITLTNNSPTDDASYSASPTAQLTATSATGAVTHGSTAGVAIGFVDYSTTGPRSGSVTFANTANVSDGFNSSGNVVTLDSGSAVVNNRIVAASSVNLGTVHVGSVSSGTTNLSTTGDDDHFTRIIVAGQLFSSAASTGMATISPTISSAGPVSGSVTLSTTGEGLAGESPIDVSVPYSAAAYRLAAPNSLATPVSLGNIHVGSSFGTQALSVLNAAAADGYSEKLDASFGATTGSASTNGGTINLLSAGAVNNSSLVIGLGSGPQSTPGAIGGTARVNLASNGSGTSGLGTTALPAQTVAVTGNVYRLAVPAPPGNVNPQKLLSPVDLGIVHVGDSFGTQTVSVQNTAANDGFSEKVDAHFGALSGAATNNGGSINLLAPGAKDSSSLVVGLGGSAHTSAAGAVVGSATVNFLSDGTGTSGLGTTTLAPQSVSIAGQVNQFAQPAFTITDKAGTLTGGGTSYTLDFGGVAENSGTYTVHLAVLNDLLDPAYQDTLGGSFSTARVSHFSLTGFNPFSGVASGNSQAGLQVAFDSAANHGAFTEALTLHPTSVNSSSSTSLGDISLTVIVSQTTTAVGWTGKNSGAGTSNSSWDSTSANWSANGAAASYVEGSPVTFADTNEVTSTQVSNATVTIRAAGVQPGSVTFANSTVDYMLSNASGTIGISGSTGLTKTGAGRVTLASPNSYSGDTIVNGGALAVTAAGALGNGGGNLSINAASGASSTVVLGADQTVAGLAGSVAAGGSASLSITAGKTLTILQASSTTFGGNLINSGQLTKSGAGTLEISGSPTLNDSSQLKVIDSGKLRFNLSVGSAATIGAGVIATVESAGTLELAGSVSALASGTAPANRMDVVNNSSAASGLLVSGTSQVVGGINGNGTTEVAAGADLTANHIVQAALVIGGDAANPAVMTIAASDASGNPLDSDAGAFLSSGSGGTASASNAPAYPPLAPNSASGSSVLALADSLGASLAHPADRSTAPSFPDSSASGSLNAVPEPSTILLLALGALAIVAYARRRPKRMSIV
jgi:autotransporter-associated beta strand protein